MSQLPELYIPECIGARNEVFIISTSFLIICIIFGRAKLEKIHSFVQCYLEIYTVYDGFLFF